MGTKNKFFISINILDITNTYGFYTYESLYVPLIDIIIHINDYKCITLYDINSNNSDISLSYNNKIYKSVDLHIQYRNSGKITFYYDKYKISQINNLLIKINFVIHKLLKIIINKIYNYDYALVINDIKKLNCMWLYKSFYYM